MVRNETALRSGATDRHVSAKVWTLMNIKTEMAYRRWMQLAERGYGRTTTIHAQRVIDARIRAAKERFEKLRDEEKAKQ